LKEIVGFYRKRNQSSQYGKKLKWSIREQLDNVCMFPEGSPKYEGGPARFIVVENFVLLYEVKDDHIIVLHFDDARRQYPFGNNK
jgi:hypothetical protein